jgi:hypothetical protein
MRSLSRCLISLIVPAAGSLLILLLLAAFSVTAACAATTVSDGDPPAVVRGRVVEASGEGLPFASVFLPGTTAGAASDSTGRFRFAVRRSGRHVLRATALGYAPAEAEVELVPGDTTTVRLVMGTRPVALPEATVTGSSHDTDAGTVPSLSPTEALTTPGASGDVFRALQALPGVGAPGDGAGLFVQGGDVSETRVLLDGAPVFHPYRYESPVGGTFGSVSPYLIGGTTFAQGGFGARYGGALSGVLALETRDRPEASRQYVNLGLAAASVEVAQPITESSGLRVAGNRSFTGLLFRVNGRGAEYEPAPHGLEGSASLHVRDTPVGSVKLTSVVQREEIGVESQAKAFSGLYRQESLRQMHVVRWEAGVGRAQVASAASWSASRTERRFGVMDARPSEHAATARVDVTHPAGSLWVAEAALRGGVTVERRQYRYRATLPAIPDVLDPGADTVQFDTDAAGMRVGGYVEADASRGPLSVTAGVRADAHSRTGSPVVDPRLSATLQLGPSTRARLAWGRYHQVPEPETYAQHAGTGTLGAQQADHLVGDVRHERGDWLLRLGAYYKTYRDLAVRTGPQTAANAGTGRARGLDAFVRYGAFLDTRVSGWASYSLVHSTRTQPRDVGRIVVLDDGPAPFDLTHQASVVGKVNVAGGWHVGGSVRWITGEPFTPVVRAVPAPGGGVLPVDGPVGSARQPAYSRVDLQTSYFYPFGDGQHAIVYLALQNALDRANVTGVAYDADYSERSWQTSPFRRAVYAGLTLQL